MQRRRVSSRRFERSEGRRKEEEDDDNDDDDDELVFLREKLVATFRNVSWHGNSLVPMNPSQAVISAN